jgi:hypothetical protein
MNKVPTSSDNASYAIISGVFVDVALNNIGQATIIANSKALIMNTSNTAVTNQLSFTGTTITIGADPMASSVTVSSTDKTKGRITLSSTIAAGTTNACMITGISIANKFYQYARIRQSSDIVIIPIWTADSDSPSGTFTSPSAAIRCPSLTTSSMVLLGFLGYGASLTGITISVPRRTIITTNQMRGIDSYWANSYNYFVITGALHNSQYSYNVIDA